MKGFVRVWKELDLLDVEKHLIVVGDLASECFSCHKIDLTAKTAVCPACGAAFKYMGFRRHLTMGYLKQVREELPHLVFIDFEDFKKAVGKHDARKLLDI